jgi:hypothetical protein
MNRRHFIKLGVVGTGAALAGVEAVSAQNTPIASIPSPTLVAMPICVAPLATGDLDAMFDDMRNRAGVNALFPFIYSHEPSRAGVERSAGFHGGNYAMPHMEFYKDTQQDFADLRAPEFGDVDVLARVIPVARKHGIRVFPFLLEDNALPAAVPHRQAFYEVDHHGHPTSKRPGGPCFNNPYYRNFTLGLVEDYARSYDIGGIMWGSERQGGLLNTLGISQSSGEDPGGTTCFCEFCVKKGRDRGIDVERARRGFDEMENFARASRAGQRPRDGYFTTFWRLLLNYPEVLAWEKNRRGDAGLQRRPKPSRKTVDEVRQQGIVDEIILVDDRSRDNTVQWRHRCSACASMSTKKTPVTAATKKPATASRSTRARTSSSWCTRIINTRPS